MKAVTLPHWTYAEPTAEELRDLRRGGRIEARCIAVGRVWAIVCGDERVYYVPGREALAKRAAEALNSRPYNFERLRHFGRLQRGEAVVSRPP